MNRKEWEELENKNGKEYIIKRVESWIRERLDSYKDNNLYLSVSLKLNGHDMTTKEIIYACEDSMGAKIQDKIEYINLEELK